MRLLHFDGKTCKHTTDIMPGVKAVYQMEQEFSPYLDIAFMSNDEHEELYSGIVLQTKNGIFKKYYNFMDKADIEELRELIWKYLLKEVDIKDITVGGCLKDFRKTDTFRVGRTWRDAVKEHKRHIYPNIKFQKSCNGMPDMDHDVYRLNSNDKFTKDKCRLMRMKECYDNYLDGTYTFDICKTEVDWLCNHADVDMSKVQKERARVGEVLKKNNMFVSKKEFDDAIDVGFFYSDGRRAGNFESDYKRGMDDDEYYQSLVEDFDGIHWTQYLGLIMVVVVVAVWIWSKYYDN